MRKYALVSVLLLGLVAGCAGKMVSVTPTSLPTLAATAPPPPTITPEAAAALPPASGNLSSGPATCVAEPLDLPLVSNIPPVAEGDHVHGPADASITLIEYADFQ
jgi:hypothetical protein